MLLGAIFFFVAYLVTFAVDSRHKIERSRVLDKEGFRENFTASLEELIRMGIIKFEVVHTPYYRVSRLCLFASVLCCCLKLIALLLKML